MALISYQVRRSHCDEMPFSRTCDFRSHLETSNANPPLVIASGPKRYAYAFENHQWRNTRDGHALCELLSDELTKVSGMQLRLKDPIVN
jgi:hypothetical protein